MNMAVRNVTQDVLPMPLPSDLAPASIGNALPALAGRPSMPALAEIRMAVEALVGRAVATAGLEPFIRLGRLYPALVQGIALPLGALLVMCLVMGGPAMLVVGAYFVGCGMILSRKAVKTLLDQAPACVCGRQSS